MKIGLCDDDLNVLDDVKKYLLEYEKEKKFPIKMEFFTKGKELLESVSSYDILFLDIEIKDENGIQIAKNLRERDTQTKIVYITSYSEYREYAFSVHAFDYIVKPITYQKISDVINEIIEYNKNLIDYNEEVYFFSKGRRCKLRVKNIVCFEYENRNIIVHLTDQRKVCLEKNKISDIYVQMKKFGFGLPHKSFVVNYDYIDSIRKYMVYTTHGISIPLSQKYSKSFRKEFDIYLKNKIYESM